jgi:TRAP transporter TAXI family solute receptor
MTPIRSRRALLLSALATPALATRAEAQAPPSLSQLTARANAGTVGIIAGGVDGTYIRFAADLASVLDDGELRVLAIIGKGSVQNISDIMLVRGIDIGIVQADALAFARRNRLLPGVETLIQYIAKLYDEEIHLLVRPGINSVADLAGQTVNVDVRGSGTAMTASLVFEGLGVRPTFANDPQDVALTRLRAGEIAAMMFVAGKPARLFAGIPPDSGLSFLPIPATPALLETYVPSSLTAADYPALVPAGPGVETIAVGAVMAVYAWTPGTERHRKVARFVEALNSRFDQFLRPPRHPKWREVNLAAQVPGWVRFDHAAPQRPAPRRREGEG